MSTKVAWKNVIQPVVLSIPQAGASLSVSPDTVRRLIRNGAIPHARIGNSIRIRRADLDGYLERQISRQWQPVNNRGGGLPAGRTTTIDEWLESRALAGILGNIPPTTSTWCPGGIQRPPSTD